jgi:hypothetical protein
MGKNQRQIHFMQQCKQKTGPNLHIQFKNAV